MLAVAGGAWLQTLASQGDVWGIVWLSVIGGLLGLAIAIVAIFIWNLFRAPYKQRNEARASLKNWKQWEEFLKHIKKGDVITDKIINVPLLFQLQSINTLASVTFIRCILKGPYSMRIEGKSSEVKGVDFQGKLDESFIELNREGTYYGLVRFVFCKFEYCKFENISIVGSKSTYDKIKENSVEL